MKIVEILTIGREILDGRITDTNSVYLGEELSKRGLVPRFAQRVDDHIPRIVDALRLAASRSNLIFVTGGLGPTSDDLTAEAFAVFKNERPTLNPQALKEIEAYFKRIGREMIATQSKQAMLAPSCFVLHNRVGSAPGFGWKDSQNAFYFMPGIPAEMKAIFAEEILPTLEVDPGYRSFTWATQFTSEGELQQRLGHLQLPENFELSYRTRFPENHIGLHAYCRNEKDEALFKELSEQLEKILGTDVFTQGEKLLSLEEVVIANLKEEGALVATVESCTGGLIAHRLSNVAGSSEVFIESFVSYHNDAKLRLGVSPELLGQHGAVSAEVARAMAEAGLKALESLAAARGAKRLFCVATTGIAGPGGGSAAKPVGLCHIALAERGQATLSEELRGRAQLDRQALKLYFSQKALNLLRTKTL